jgi:hypothetical protein
MGGRTYVNSSDGPGARLADAILWSTAMSRAPEGEIAGGLQLRPSRAICQVKDTSWVRFCLGTQSRSRTRLMTRDDSGLPSSIEIKPTLEFSLRLRFP